MRYEYIIIKSDISFGKDDASVKKREYISKKKNALYSKIRYAFDCMLSRGTIAMTGLLFLVTFIIIAAIAGISCLIDKEHGLAYQTWLVLMHTLDTGNLAANSTGNIPYIIMMSIATFSGIFITSILIGLISAGVKNGFESLAEGKSVVQEKNHIVIIGFNSNIRTLIKEFSMCGDNTKRCIVILGNIPKQKMEKYIFDHIKPAKNIRIVCRSGILHEAGLLKRCAIENASSIIVNSSNDAETIKILLAVSTYISAKKEKKEYFNKNLNVVASVQDEQYQEGAKEIIVGDKKANVVFVKDAIAKIISNTCNNHGVSQVLTEFFNFDGNELYFETVPGVVGKSFKEALLCFENAVPVGIVKVGEDFNAGDPKLLPDMEKTTIEAGDQLILLEEKKGAFIFNDSLNSKINEEHIKEGPVDHKKKINNLLIIGSNDKLPEILKDYNTRVAEGTVVSIIDNDAEEKFNNKIVGCTNLVLDYQKKEISTELLGELVEKYANNNVINVLLLNDDTDNNEEKADSKNLLYLVLLRSIADDQKFKDKKIFLTTEMKSSDNRRLASRANVDDFVIGADYICLLLAQYSENPNLAEVFEELLSDKGAELYMRPAKDYVVTGESVNICSVVESVSRKDEIFVGYMDKSDRKNKKIVVNPSKLAEVTFAENDKIIVLAID